MNQFKLKFSRLLRLGPALGDWTKLVPQIEEDRYEVAAIRNTGFDVLTWSLLSNVHDLHYRIAEKLLQRLASDLYLKPEFHSIEAIQWPYADFIGSLDEKLVQADMIVNQTFRVHALYSWSLTEMLVSRLVGGTLDSDGLETITDVQSSILNAQFESLTSVFSEGWRSIFTPENVQLFSSFGSFKPSRRVLPSDAFTCFKISFNCGSEVPMSITIAYPNYLLASMWSQYMEKQSPKLKGIQLSKMSMTKQRVDVSCVLGHAALTMSELESLQEGDVIPLDSSIQKPLRLNVGDSVDLMVQPGVLNDNVAVQVIKEQSEEDEIDVNMLGFPVVRSDDSSSDINDSSPYQTFSSAPIPNESISEGHQEFELGDQPSSEVESSIQAESVADHEGSDSVSEAVMEDTPVPSSETSDSDASSLETDGFVEPVENDERTASDDGALEQDPLLNDEDDELDIANTIDETEFEETDSLDVNESEEVLPDSTDDVLEDMEEENVSETLPESSSTDNEDDDEGDFSWDDLEDDF